MNNPNKIVTGLAAGVAGVAIGVGGTAAYNAMTVPAETVSPNIENTTTYDINRSAEAQKELNKLGANIAKESFDALMSGTSGAELVPSEDEDAWWSLNNKIASIATNKPLGAESRFNFVNTTGEVVILGASIEAEDSFNNFTMRLKVPDLAGGEMETPEQVMQAILDGKFQLESLVGRNTYKESFVAVGATGDADPFVTYGNNGYIDYSDINEINVTTPKLFPGDVMFNEGLETVTQRATGTTSWVNKKSKETNS